MDYVWIMYGYVWRYVWICMDMQDMYGYVWICMGMYGYVWICMDMYGYVWICMDMYGYAGYVCSLKNILFHGLHAHTGE